jgi:uncharacterized protein (TIGR02646 family)
MKYIQKGNEPAELHHWVKEQPIENGNRINCRYADMPGEVKRLVKQRLVEEQGGLCCYTGIRISENESHIEHFKPQSRCDDGEDIDYTNLMAAYPGQSYERTNGRCKFGAHAKHDWYDEALLVSPLRGDCEDHFKFDQFGNIKHKRDADRTAIETIKRLGLNHSELIELRKQAIEKALFPKGHRLSKQQLGEVAKTYCHRNATEPFRPFCFVIAQVAQQLLQKAERKRKNKRFSCKQVHQ